MNVDKGQQGWRQCLLERVDGLMEVLRQQAQMCALRTQLCVYMYGATRMPLVDEGNRFC
jgi:hypothetical protein